MADPERFPSGMKALADYVRSKGLKFALYSDAGTETCAGRPGSKDHEVIDAKAWPRAASRPRCPSHDVVMIRVTPGD